MSIRKRFGKFYLILVVVFVFIMVCFGILTYQSTAVTLRTQLGNKCLGIASAVAVIIDDDIEEFIEFSKTLDMESDYYKAIRAKLTRIRDENDGSIAFLYVETRISDNEIMYVLDSEHEDTEFFTPPGYSDDITQPERDAYASGMPFIPHHFASNQYGTLLTCYMPLHNPSDGSVIGLVGVDVSIDQYNAVMRSQLLTVIVSIGLLILLLLLTLALSSSQIERLVARDNLTGIFNKSHYMSSLREQLQYAKRKNKPVAVFMADLDHFKRVNDEYGHVFGDVVLSTVADTISKQLRKADCLGRYGGEEFSAYLPDIGIESATNVVERIRQAVETTKVFNHELNEYIPITISIGVAAFEPHHSVQKILSLADKALYQAKKTRNAIAVYDKDAHE